LIYSVQESIPCDGGTKAQELLENHVSGKPSTKIERSGLGKASCNELMSMNCKRWSMSGTWIAILVQDIGGKLAMLGITGNV